MAGAKGGFKWQPLLIAAVVVIALALLAWMVKGLIEGGPGKPKKPPKISLIPNTPPPPPPPPKEEKPPPPKEVKEAMEQPVQKLDAPPDDPTLKMEGEAGDGPSLFAAGKVSSEDLSRFGSGRMHGLYIDRLQRHLQEQLNRNRKLKLIDYRVILRVWLGPDGAVQRAELAQSTGSEEIDGLLRQTLLQAAAMRDAPPENMPQPIRIRVTARGAG